MRLLQEETVKCRGLDVPAADLFLTRRAGALVGASLPSDLRKSTVRMGNQRPPAAAYICAYSTLPRCLGGRGRGPTGWPGVTCGLRVTPGKMASGAPPRVVRALNQEV